MVIGSRDSDYISEPNTIHMEDFYETMSKKKLVFEIIAERHDIYNKEIAEKLNCSPKTVYRYIKELKSVDIIKRVGSDKQGYWKINKKM